MKNIKKLLLGISTAIALLSFVWLFSVQKVLADSYIYWSTPPSWVAGSYTYVSPTSIDAKIKITDQKNVTITKTYTFNRELVNQPDTNRTDTYNRYQYKHSGDDGLCSDAYIYVFTSDFKTGYISAQTRPKSSLNPCVGTDIPNPRLGASVKEMHDKISSPIGNSALAQNTSNAAVANIQKVLQEGAKTLRFQNRFVIVGDFDFDLGGPNPATQIKFVDSDPSDNTYKYKDQGDVLCGKGEGIEILNNGIAFTKMGHYSNVEATVDIDARTDSKSKTCDVHITPPNSAGKPTNLKVTLKNPDNASLLYKWGGANGSELIRADDKGGTFTALNNNQNVLATSTTLSDCPDIILLDSPSAGTMFSLNKNPGDKSVNDFPQLNSLYSGPSTPCYVGQVNLASSQHFKGQLTDIAKLNFTIDGTRNQAPANVNGGTNTDTKTCEDNGPLAWIFCPMLRLVNDAVSTFYDQVDAQLCFRAGDSSTAGGVTCKGSTLLTVQVQQAWSIVKNLSSVILVLIMLLAIIAQALDFGPIDAYTLRKLLPKLVVGVIVMQISFVLAKFAIDITNDIGAGLKQILYAPFDPNVGNIDYALRNIHELGGLGLAGLFVGAIVIGVFSGLTFFGIGIIGLSVLAAVFVAFLVLLFRQVLIILSVIFMPLAIVAWMLPGTERYWKLWRENFIKLLAMYPLIVAIIAGGRIFGYIAGTSSSGITALLAVLVGFFGPLFILPKTYQWGGQALGSLGGAVVNGTKGLRRKPYEYAMNVAKENRAFRGQQRAVRIGRDPVGASRWDRLLAGGYNFARGERMTGGRAARMQKYGETVATGQKAAREAVASELLVSGFNNWRHEDKLDALEAWLRGESYNGIDASNNEELRLHAFKMLADLGDQDRIRKARHDGKLRGSTWLKGRMENISSLNTQASDMGIQPDLTTVSADSMTQWKSHTFDEWLRQYEKGVIMDNRENAGGDLQQTPAQHAEMRRRAAGQARRIISNSLLFDRLSADQQEKVRQAATLDGTETYVQPNDGEALVPTGNTIATNQSVRENIMQNLATPPSRRTGSGGPDVASGLAPRIIEAARTSMVGIPLTPDQQGDLLLFEQIRDQAITPNATSEMTTARDNLRTAVINELNRQESEVERQYTAAGSPNVGVMVNNAQAQSTAVRTTLGI